MNYGELRDYSLQLINQYSIAGDLYKASYNNQQDYILRIPALVNDALIYIASAIRKLPAQAILSRSDGEVWGRYVRHKLPEDYMQLHGGGMLLLNADPSGRRALNEYVLQEPDYILLPDWVKGDVVFEYYRTPALVSLKPSDEDKIDATLEAQMAIAYYVAAHLVMYDDASMYTTLYNEFENKAARLARPVTTEISRVYDAYGYEGVGDAYG